MKFDSRYSAPIRPLFRIPALLLGTAQLIFGIIFLVDGGFKVGIPQIVVGLMFLIAGIKGQLPKWLDSEEREKEYEKKLSEGKLNTRKVCLLSLGAQVFIISVIIIMFLTTDIYSIGWWVILALTIFSSVGFYLNSAILLESKGFHSLLALTVIFPLILLAIGVVNPRKFEKINLA